MLRLPLGEVMYAQLEISGSDSAGVAGDYDSPGNEIQIAGHRPLMNNRFHLFGPVHLLILAAVPTVALLFTMAARQSRASARRTRYALGSLLAINEVAWYAYRLHFEGFRFPRDSHCSCAI